MTRIFFRGVSGQLGPDYDPRCAVACHAIGEPGLDDGGFVSVAPRFEDARLLPRGEPGAWDHLPSVLPRLGGVGCTGCHGPGAIPERTGRWAILRVEVCASCHDAPPRYGHVVAWRTSAMARSDAQAETRVGRCAACHTT